MNLQERKAFYGHKKAKALGLTSQRFHDQQMSKNARQAIEHVKKKDRSDIKLNEWKINNYCKSNATELLFNCPDEVPRIDYDKLSTQEFIQKYQKNNLPVIIKGCTKNWNMKNWSFESFYHRHKQTKFKIGQDDDGYKLRVPFKYYLQYLVYNKDDSPLYLFQSSLEDKEETKEIINDYEVPKYFKDDLFKLIGEKKRPPYRWLLMGPQRSGTTVHLDPLNTSAWNTSLVGHKRWVLFSETLPKSIAKGKAYRYSGYEDEAINYFTEILPKIRRDQDRKKIKMIQFIQYPGQTVFVPGGWWHAVINLDDTMAVTQNVMTHINFDKVWRSVRCQRRKFAEQFLQKLYENERQLYNRAIQLNAKDNYQMGNKYCKQSVSLSFTPSSSSSSSSSSSRSSSSSQSEQESQKGKNNVKVKNFANKKKNNSIRSRSYSRSRDKNKKTHHSFSEQKKSIGKSSQD